MDMILSRCSSKIVTSFFHQYLTLKLHFQQRPASSDFLQECQKPHTNPSPSSGRQHWALISDFGHAGNKQRQQTRNLASTGECARSPSAEKDTEDREQPEEDGAGQLPAESDAIPGWFCPQRIETRDGRKCQHYRAPNAGSSHHGDPSTDLMISSITGKCSSVTETALPQESFASEASLRLQIKVSGQSGGLGISIAGGIGSMPYQDQDEGIFISRVNKGGASEKAGVLVGDRLLEVNGLNMQLVTHHGAVTALRNAGSCIKMKVLRERLLPRELCDPGEHKDLWDVTRRQPCSQEGGSQRGKQPNMENTDFCFSKKIEKSVCNGNGISDLYSELSRDFSEPKAQTLMKNDSLPGGKHTMTIPRIILTHPSTSDEDVELLTQITSRETLHNSEIHDSHPYCFDSAFYPP
ncbi:protein scribble homolog [Eleginops maclovinus]|uniref:protein scribble homolog n=1 Tax=Eleginops maclovinus TaxID=56733 RepID=UPI00308041B3